MQKVNLMDAKVTKNSLMDRVVRYDRERRRVWVVGWRLHHGFTGMILAAIGGALMAHDWKDRPHWLHDVTDN
jgi:hypothetical protein